MTIKRQIFYSFHYKNDVRRASLVRNMGVIEGNKPVSDNDWEEVKRGGDPAIKRWIAEQMKYRSCTVVLVGTETANRKWINHEIRESWKAGMGVAGIYIHGLKDPHEGVSSKGDNPFDYVNLGKVVKCYSPRGINSKERYAWIKDYLSAIIEEAIEIRGKYK